MPPPQKRGKAVQSQGAAGRSRALQRGLRSSKMNDAKVLIESSQQEPDFLISKYCCSPCAPLQVRYTHDASQVGYEV